MNDAPELIELLQDFKSNLNEVKDNIQPLLESVRKQEIKTNKGISFLQAKFHLLLSYCINIGYYLLLKSVGKPVKDHPVIGELVKLRVFLEKIRPLDQKLKYQIDKLLKIAATGNISEDTNDPTRFKPNPQSMKNTNIEEVDDDAELEKNQLYINHQN